VTVILCGSLLLSGCKSDEEEAESHYSSGIAYLDQGDEDRALIEFMNVFRYSKYHEGALWAYAGILQERGQTAEAFNSYLSLVERHPNSADARLALAELAVATGNWDEVRRQGGALSTLAPEESRTRFILLALDYHAATVARDGAERDRIASEAADKLDTLRAGGEAPDGVLLRIAIDHRASGEDAMAALPSIDAALGLDPRAADLNLLKLRILTEAGETEATGDQLRQMVELYPQNAELRQALISWYVAQERFDDAELLLREQAGADTENSSGHLEVIEFLQSMHGPDAARQEIERLRSANEGSENARYYSAMLASMDFEAGQTEAAIAGMHAILDGAEPGPQTRDHQVQLAKMLARTGDEAGARALVGTVLEEDSGHGPALMMRADWLIGADLPEEAILALRTALEKHPRDAEALTLMARAHERNGDTLLMGDRLAMAFEESDAAPAEAMRYARYLLSDGQSTKAASTLEAARARAPGNLDVLSMLSGIYLGDHAWSDAQSIVEGLDAIDTGPARDAALALKVAILEGQGRTGEKLALLKTAVGDDLVETDQDEKRPVSLLVQAHIDAGRIAEARAFLNEALAKSPRDYALQLLDANVNVQSGALSLADSGYRSLIDQYPLEEEPVLRLMAVLFASDRESDARIVLKDALERLPDSTNLLSIQADLHERDRNFDEATKLYEALYAQDRENLTLANNLANLLAMEHQDPEDLERAYGIAKRLRGSDVPAHKDTYGWIEFRRGNHQDALRYLTSAAAELEADPMAQYHLGMVYAKLGHVDDARVTLTRALVLADAALLPHLDDARETLATISEPEEVARKD